MATDESVPPFQAGGDSSQQEINKRSSSTTIVVISHPVTELIAELSGPGEAFLGNRPPNNEEENPNSCNSLGAPFVNSADPGLRLGFGNGGFNFFGGGGPFGPPGGPSGIQPDTVAPSFKLEAIGGLDEQIKYLKRSVILPLVKPKVLEEWGVSPPKGILLHGPPGTGKTFMAKALVNELKKHLHKRVNFYYRKGGDVFSMWFGESQRKLREVFDTAKRNYPSVIFFDEIDGLCPSREGKNHGTEAYNSVVTCFLGQMDALENGKVFVIAATNRVDAVDPAVRRPGRFDKHLAFGFPDEAAREKIIDIHTSKWNENDRPQKELRAKLAARTMGYSGADIEKLCKDVVYTAMEENAGSISDAMIITENHWIKSINSMQRTASDSFGSALYIPSKPNETISLLIRPLVEEAVSKIAPMMSEVSILQSHSTILKTFVLCIAPPQSKSFLNAQILQAILSDPLFAKSTIYELSTTKIVNKVMNNQSPTIAAALQTVINQARDAAIENPAVVFAPNLNELLALWKANHMVESTFFNMMSKIRGPKMLLLATSSLPISEIEKGFAELFYDRYMLVQNPKNDHLRGFFKTMMDRKRESGSQNALKALDTAAMEAAKIAENYNYEQILNLWEALEGVRFDDGENENGMMDHYKSILDKFQESKLR